MSYWVAVVARNASQHIRATLNSLVAQTLRPKGIVVVDDGSTDDTPMILSSYEAKHPRLFRVIKSPDYGYDIRRVPSNINIAWNKASEIGLKIDYFMISGDDCKYPKNYARTLILKMRNDPRLAVASGHPSPGLAFSEEHSPAGSGRMIRCSFWREVGSRYPVKAGWETWLLYKAVERGYKVRLFPEVAFEHVRPRGAGHQFAYWGAAMHSLGYHPLYAVGRIAKNMVGRRLAIRGSLNMLRGYIRASLGSADPFISSFEPSLRKFISTEQSRRIANVVTALH